MIRRFSINFALLSMAFDAAFIAVGLWLSTVLRPYLNDFAGIELLAFPVIVPVFLYILFPLIWVLIFIMLSIYDGRKYLRAIDEFVVLSLAVLLASVSSAGVLYFSYRDISRVMFIIFVVAAYIFCCVWRVLIRSYFRAQNLSTDREKRILVVGAGSLGMKVYAQILEARDLNLKPLGFVDEKQDPSNMTPLFLGKSENIKEIIQEHNISDVVIALPHSAYYQMGNIVQRLNDLPVQVWVALGFFDLALYNTTIEDFAGIPMLDLRASAIDDYQRMVKRAFDLFFGLIALVIALPFMAISALMIFLEDGPPVFFRQKRVGENGRLFEMLKFRTMVRNAEELQRQVEKRDEDGNVLHKLREDPRITRSGRFLRRFSLDELPQFINVVRGEMSLVGPRPEMPYLVEKYQPWQRKRFAIPPGITGWWQVNGRSDKPMHLYTEDDLYYIANYSLWLDILILMRTIWVVVIGKGAY